MFFVAAVVLLIGGAAVQRPLWTGGMWSAADSFPEDTVDALPATPWAADSMLVTDSTLVADSLAMPRLPLDTTVIALGDTTLTVEADTAQSGGLDSPVDFSAKDSLVYDMESGNAYLYGDAKVHYQNMDLNADVISMNMDSSLVHANGVPDSTGVFTGTPIYTQGRETYESQSMSFNFKTKRGFITSARTEQGQGYLFSNDSKRVEDGSFNIQNATYSTCDADHPHFYLKLTKGKTRPGKDVFFGPAYLVVEDVPLPLAIPYGFFPFTQSYSSGIIMPTFGEESSRGFYLRDGGYYLALSDKIDLKLIGEIYSKGSWALSAESAYAKRYKFRGNLMLSYQVTVNGDRNMPDYMRQTSFKFTWSHSSDSKANPNQTFSARVNFATSNYEKTNLNSMYNPLSNTQSTRASSISYGRTFPKLGMSLQLSTNITQNVRDSSLSVTLPDLSVNVSRFYPFRRKHAAGKERWYEKISMSYTGQMTNSFSGKEDRLFKSNIAKEWRNGMQHRVPIDATFQVLKYINISPSFSFRDIMYLSRQEKSWDRNRQREVTDTVFGFYNLYDWNTSVSANTTLYGFFKPMKKIFGDKIQMVRHVLKPTVSFSYAPDFSTSYTDTYIKTDANGEVTQVTYSPYQGMVYGYPSGSMSGNVSFGLSNNVEMKVKSSRDSTGTRKISLIDEFGLNMSYNFAAKTRPWSDLSMRIRLKLTKRYTFSMNATFATYAYEKDPQTGRIYVGERTEYSYGRFGRFQGMSQNFSYTIDNQKAMMFLNLLRGRGWQDLFNQYAGDKDKKDRKPGYDDEDDYELDDEQNPMSRLNEEDEANIDPDLRKKKNKRDPNQTVDEWGYLRFSIPWRLSVSYGVSMREDTGGQINESTMRYPYKFTHTLSFSGNVQLAKGWNISFNSGYDFNAHDLSMTTMSLSRDLHCFEMSCSVVLKPYTSYNFSFRARAQELADVLRYEKRSVQNPNIQWY